VRPLLALWVCAALGFGATPAFAFKNLAGCDLVAFTAMDSPMPLAPERWQVYRDSVIAILGSPPDADATLAAWRALANRVIEAQRALLAPVQDSQAYRDYLAGDRCRALAELDAGAIDALLDEAAQTTSEPIAAALRRVTQAARLQIDNIERSARFRSSKDKTAFAAEYYCFVAGAILALLPPDRQRTVTLESFGTTIACRDIGRTG
jgi:hypothetical protein